RPSISARRSVPGWSARAAVNSCSPPVPTGCRSTSRHRRGRPRLWRRPAPLPPYNPAHMGAPQARVRLEGDRLDLEWPGVATCVELVANCRLTAGDEHQSARWEAVGETPGRYHASCGPLDVELELSLRQGWIGMRVETIAVTPVAVGQVAISARAELAGANLAWVLCNGYHSWDQSSTAVAAGACR